MATYSASDINTKPVPSIDNALVVFGNSTPGANTATADILRPCKIPAGFRVTHVLVNVRTAFAATAPAKIGLTHVDGSTPAAANPDTLLVAATDTAHATTGVKTLMPQAGPFLTEKDSYLTVVFGTIATAASGVADYVVCGEWVGVK